jgi:hypothetical protein
VALLSWILCLKEEFNFLRRKEREAASSPQSWTFG